MSSVNATTRTIVAVVCTCERVAVVVPGVLGVDLTGWSTVPLQILLQVPAFSLIKRVEEQGKFLHVQLLVLTSLEDPRLANHQWADEARVEISLLNTVEKHAAKLLYYWIYRTQAVQ